MSLAELHLYSPFLTCVDQTFKFSMQLDFCIIMSMHLMFIREVSFDRDVFGQIAILSVCLNSCFTSDHHTFAVYLRSDMSWLQ